MEKKLGFYIFIFLLTASYAFSQSSKEILSGTISDQNKLVIRGASVSLIRIESSQNFLTTTTDSRGHFEFKDVPKGKYLLRVQAVGFAIYNEEQNVPANDLSIVLTIEPLSQVVQVTATQNDFVTEQTVPQRELDEKMSRDLAQTLREEPGVFAARRGQINLDPQIRGLAETQVGMFVDGTRTFAAGPARMDSEMSHVSLRDVQEILITKGPYALTTGAGTMSAVEVETFSPPFYADKFELHGRGGFNYGSNGAFRDGFGTFWGGNERIRGSLSHNWKKGNDYKAGDGNYIQGNFLENATRATFGFKPTARTFLEYKFGFQQQENVDYEGMILDANYFITRSHLLSFSYSPTGNLVTQFFGKFYVNNKSHLMNNDNKPTAQPNPNRMPPFALRIDLPTQSKSYGGNYYVALNRRDYDFKVGGDFYSVTQNANRYIYRRDTGMLMFSDIIWGDSNIRDEGFYFNTIKRSEKFSVGGTFRIDFVQAETNNVSSYFLANTTGNLSKNETNISAAVSTRFRVSEYFSVSTGFGRAVRTATSLERYSDRIPTTKFQLSAEFMGNPNIKPEASLEFNLGGILDFYGIRVEADAFYRNIDNYITIKADPTLTRRLPMSATTVFRYINGTNATFYGGDLKIKKSFGKYLDGRGSLSYVWGKDSFLNEPVIGVPPLQGQLGFRLYPAKNLYVDLNGTFVDSQNRISSSRFEKRTGGYSIFDIRGGYRFAKYASFNAGIENITDKYYSNHLNALNPFTGRRIPEIGRNFRIGLELFF